MTPVGQSVSAKALRLIYAGDQVPQSTKSSSFEKYLTWNISVTMKKNTKEEIIKAFMT